MTQAVYTASRNNAQLQHREVLVARHVRELFSRLPTLAAFRLRNDLIVAEVSAVDRSNCMPMGRLHVRVMQALVELAERDPEAIGHMRGRTFARRLH